MEINVEGNRAGPVAARMQAEKLVNSRRIEAPPALVYEAWTSLPHLKRWWNPAGFTWVRATLRLRPGGVFHYCLRSLNGETRDDCRGACDACGILPTFAEMRSLHPGDSWKCPEVTPKSRRGAQNLQPLDLPVLSQEKN